VKILAPLINDISSDVEDPPEFTDGQRDELPERFRRAIRRHYPQLAPLELELGPDRAHELALELAERVPTWTITAVDSARRIIEGTAQTKLLRFVDDWVIRVRSRADGSVIDMRSASRLGRGDFGTNAERIGRFLDKMRERAQGAGD
jgi:uncharacterized protein (DUF1499 family)